MRGIVTTRALMRDATPSGTGRSFRVAAWQVAQSLAAPGAERKLAALATAALPTADATVLDVGCGPRSPLAAMGVARLVGLDRSAPSLHAFAATRGAQAVRGDATKLPFRDASFDAVACFGLLHHLPDAEVSRALAEMRRVAGPAGRIIVFDGVLPRRAATRPLAWSLRRLDRGCFMRSEDGLRALLDARGAWRCQRSTYAWTGVEGLFCQSLPESPVCRLNPEAKPPTM